MKHHSPFIIIAAVMAIAVAGLGVLSLHHASAGQAENGRGWLWSDMPDGSDQCKVGPAPLNALIPPDPGCAQTGNGSNLFSGRGLGWISVNDVNQGSGGGTYGVHLDPATGDLSGYAWSEYGGWLHFDATGFPLAGGTAATTAKIEPTCWANAAQTGCQVIGWARFVAGTDPNAGGWDGWVSLRKNTAPAYGVMYDKTTKQFSGMAWGDWVAGWIDFSGMTIDETIVPPVVDMCDNIAGPQGAVPAGHHTEIVQVANTNHNSPIVDALNTHPETWCVPDTSPDLCTNLAGPQSNLPIYFAGVWQEDPNSDGICTPMIVQPPDPNDPGPGSIDLCTNLVGLQLVLPTFYNNMWHDDPNGDKVCTRMTNPPVFGCTNPAATNYNPNATYDDGSCIYSGGGSGTGSPINPIYQEN